MRSLSCEIHELSFLKSSIIIILIISDIRINVEYSM